MKALKPNVVEAKAQKKMLQEIKTLRSDLSGFHGHARSVQKMLDIYTTEKA